MYINVNDYKDKTSDWEMIQSAIDDAAITGKAVVIPKTNERTKKAIWDIDKTILLVLSRFTKGLNQQIIVLLFVV